MIKLKIGIMPRDQFQKRVLDIASGKVIPARGEPKIWFSSLKSLSAVLSENNVRLLKLIDEHQPETLSELALLSGREPSNLSRTLKTLERYGLVELKKKQRSLKPIAKATIFDIQYAIA
jgi:predicted transcriptional regulator